MPATRRSRKAVARAWTRVLDRRSLRADLPFDEAGGDSLQLIRLIFELETQCGTSLELAPFSGDLRPSDMARALDRCLRKSDRMTKRDIGGIPDVFLLPAIGGDDPRLVNFRAACRPAFRVELVELGDWPELIAPGYDLADLVGSLAQRIMDRAPVGSVAPGRLVVWRVTSASRSLRRCARPAARWRSWVSSTPPPRRSPSLILSRSNARRG